MRGKACAESQPALVRTKLIDRGDGTYMCEYRPWLTGSFAVNVTLDACHISGSPYNLNVVTLRPDATKCEVRGDALQRATSRLPAKFEILFIDALGHPAQAEEVDVFVEQFVLPGAPSARPGCNLDATPPNKAPRFDRSAQAHQRGLSSAARRAGARGRGVTAPHAL